MDLHYKQEVTVGLLVVVALAVMIGGLTYLSGKQVFGSRMATFGVRIDNVSGLGEGDPVQISGVRVGRVARIQLRGVQDVVAHLEVHRSVAPKEDAKVVVRPLDAFGAMFVDYDPGTGAPLESGEIVAGRRDLPLTELAGSMAGQASNVLTGAGTLLSERTADDLHATLVAAQRALNTVADVGGPLGRDAQKAIANLASATTRLDSTLGSPDLARAVAQLDEVTDNLNDMVVGLGDATRGLARIMARVEGDSGSLGRMVNDTTMYAEVVRLTTSLRLLLDDMRERPQRYFNLSVF
jgi:phospholipid/cholesterol/gamma-HCH transport system substrate-binding protein